MIECRECEKQATHILVTYMHDIVGEGDSFCAEHAFDAGREECPCCGDYRIKFEDQAGEKVELLPTYPEGALDGEGCCSEHP